MKALIAPALGLALTVPALAQDYALVGSYAVPFNAYDILPDGRLLGISGTDILIQDGLNASTYTALGSLPAGSLPSFGASFLSVSPSGARIAIGDNGFPGTGQDVFILNVADLSTSAPTIPAIVNTFNSNGAWADESTLFVSGAIDSMSPGVVNRIDADALTSTTVIANIQGASAAITIQDGALYTGNGGGAGTGFAATGAIAGFDLASLSSAVSPVDFDAGLLVADALSAFSLDLDDAGNLIVGGGSFGEGEFGYISVLEAAALATSSGDSPASVLDGQQLFPATGTFGFPSARFNPVTSEILVTDFNGSVLRYAIPAPGAAALLVMGGLAGTRRRRGA